ncbi:MAG: rhamnose:proton symporter [Candidatus Nealsonbacteria bacterium]|nr:rhamnose:proton symporter [Candidatus Nealsonbacteria bacterium]
MQPSPFLGVAVHGIGAFSAASCYAPQKQTKLWSWEVYWITQASVAWLILPITVALITIPDYLQLLSDCPSKVMWNSFLFGLLYGFGGLTFGLGIRYIGFSLNYAIAIGISAGLGTIVPLIWNPNDGFVWKLVEKFSNQPGLVVLAGIVLSWVGIVFCGWAGALREQSGGDAPSRYSFRRGVPLAVIAGILSAVYNIALEAGKPLATAAAKAADSELLSMNAIYPFSNAGAWVPSFIFCAIMIARKRNGSQFVGLPDSGPFRLPFYYVMALLSGTFWYFQFFFYGIGQAHIGKEYEFTSWALHMAMLILFSNVYGLLFREWKDAGTKSRWVLRAGMAIIVGATLLIAYGNHLGKSLTP